MSGIYRNTGDAFNDPPSPPTEFDAQVSGTAPPHVETVGNWYRIVERLLGGEMAGADSGAWASFVGISGLSGSTEM